MQGEFLFSFSSSSINLVETPLASNLISSSQEGCPQNGALTSFLFSIAFFNSLQDFTSTILSFKCFRALLYKSSCILSRVVSTSFFKDVSFIGSFLPISILIGIPFISHSLYFHPGL